MGALKLIYKNNFESETTAQRFGLEGDTFEGEALETDSLDYENARGKKRRSAKPKRKINKAKLKRVGAAILSGGASEIARKGKQFAKSKKGQALKGKLKKFGKKGMMYAKYAALSPLFAPVLPFKIPMVAMLKKRGIKTNIAEPIALIAEKFVKHVGKPMLAKGSNFDGAEYVEAEMMEAFDINNFTGYETLENSNSENIAPAIAKAVTVAIEVIIKVFKNLKKKKESGERMTADEKVGLEASEKTAEATEGKPTEELKRMMKEPETTEELKASIKAADTSSVKEENAGAEAKTKAGFSIKGMLPIIAVAVVLIFVMKK